MKRVAFYLRVSTDRSQTIENQRRDLNEVAQRLGWTVVAVHTDQWVSRAKGRDKRPGYDALLKGVARREFDLVACWSVCRLGRSLQDLLGLKSRAAISGSTFTSKPSIRAPRAVP
jgi:DNA invertase Pin-like site-specific DNA recombinase